MLCIKLAQFWLWYLCIQQRLGWFFCNFTALVNQPLIYSFLVPLHDQLLALLIAKPPIYFLNQPTSFDSHCVNYLKLFVISKNNFWCYNLQAFVASRYKSVKSTWPSCSQTFIAKQECWRLTFCPFHNFRTSSLGFYCFASWGVI